MTFPQYDRLIRQLSEAYPSISFQLGPWNPAFCSDELMQALSQASRVDGWRIQTHVSETRYQAQWALKRLGKSWARYMSDIGMLTERFSGAHCVWFDRNDIELMKHSGAQVVHNPGSNLRLQSGIAPVREFLDANVTVGFGIDSLGMNDDEDIFQDLRLARLIQGTSRIDSPMIGATTMLDMATRAGAIVAGIEGIGSLDEGNWADVVLLSRREIEGTPTAHAIAELVLMRAKPAHIKAVIIGGRIVCRDGQWNGHQPTEILEKIPPLMNAPLRQSDDRARLKKILTSYLSKGI